MPWIANLVILCGVVSVACAWTTCPFDTDVPTDCVYEQVPQNWDYPNDGNITIVTSRVRSTSAGPAKGTIWYLNGGSGVGGQCGPGHAWLSFFASQGFNVALPDFRGVGLSVPKLFCPDDPDGLNTPSVDCGEYYSSNFGSRGMYNYSITMASHDIAFLVAKHSSEGLNFVQGDSFGTFWGQRLITIYPELFDLILMESFSAPMRWALFEAPDNIQWAGQRVMEYCSQNASCGARLGGMSPVSYVERVLKLAEEGKLPCNTKLPPMFGPDYRLTYSRLLGMFMGLGMRDPFSYIPAIAYRLGRCNANDVVALTNVYMYLFPGSSSQPPSSQQSSSADPCGISQVVLYNLFFTEGTPFTTVPSLSELTAHVNKLSYGVPSAIIAPQRVAFDSWPMYPLDKYALLTTTTTKPFLMFNGDIDISTPWDNVVTTTSFYNSSNMQLFRLPMVPHVGLFFSPLPGTKLTCGLEMALSFFLSNGTAVNTSCIENIVPLDFLGGGERSMVKAVFGTEDLWEYDRPPPIEVFKPAQPSAAGTHDGGFLAKLSGGSFAGIIIGVFIGGALVGVLGKQISGNRDRQSESTVPLN